MMVRRHDVRVDMEVLPLCQPTQFRVCEWLRLRSYGGSSYYMQLSRFMKDVIRAAILMSTFPVTSP
jgi:hypothetical protein